MHFWKGFLSGICAVASLLCAFKFISMLAPESLLGHYRYQTAELSSLSPVTPDGRVMLHTAAADQFRAMQNVAQKEGIYLVALSGFRDYSHQHDLFFQGASLNNQAMNDRSRVCAPPGYSEHHTGYSIDIGDGQHKQPVFEATFSDTDAFKWMRKNAKRFHFELSFPKERRNRHVAYEPWHWRYVGDLQSLKTFFHERMVPDWMMLAK